MEENKKFDLYDMMSPFDWRYMPVYPDLAARVRKYRPFPVPQRCVKLVKEVLIPELECLDNRLLGLALEHKETVTAKRVDGKHVGEITYGEVFSAYRTRLRRRIEQITTVVHEGYLLENDKLSDLAYFVISAMSVEASIANDVRHLFRTEIGEMDYAEISKGYVGSSTMPQKVNPAGYEQIVSLWKSIAMRIDSYVLAQIVEHQGDSTNDAVLESVPATIWMTCYTTRSLCEHLGNLEVMGKR